VEPTLPPATPGVALPPSASPRSLASALFVRIASRHLPPTPVHPRTSPSLPRGSRTEYRLRFNLYANECLVFTEPRADRLCFGHNFRVPMYNKRGDCGRACSLSLSLARSLFLSPVHAGIARSSDFCRRRKAKARSPVTRHNLLPCRSPHRHVSSN